jgi:hypothetical protein
MSLKEQLVYWWEGMAVKEGYGVSLKSPFVGLDIYTFDIAMRKPLTCTSCQRPLEFRLGGGLSGLECPYCKIDYRITEAYYRGVGFLSLFAMALLGFATHTPNSDGVWLFWIILSGIPFWIFFSRVIQPLAERGNERYRLTFYGAYLTSVFVFGSEFVLILIMIYLTGSSQREVKDVLQVSSFPLSWINPHFLLTGENSLTDVCGVLLGNSLFIAVAIQLCYQPIRWLFHRSRTTQLSLSQTGSENQDD